MRDRVRFIEDLARVASGAVGAATGVRDEVEQMIRQRFERVAADLDLVSREDFAVVEALAVAVRTENETLKDQIAALEGRISKLEKTGTPAKTAAKKTAAKSTASATKTKSTVGTVTRRTSKTTPKSTGK